MKSITCYDCDTAFEAETSQEVLEKMYPHYLAEHKDVMESGTEEKKKAWMEQFHKDWEAAEEK